MWKRYAVEGALVLLVSASLVWAQYSYETESRRVVFKNGIEVSAILPVTHDPAAQDLTMTLGSTTATSIALVTGAGTATVDGTGLHFAVPAAETITAAATITANACGAIKRITAAGAVTTNTTNTLTAPSTVGACEMRLCNTGANTITLDKNALILLQGGADVALTANSCISVSSDGSVWRQTTALQTST